MRKEAAIQRELVKWLKAEHPGVYASATMNENSRHDLAMGINVGRPDLLLEHRAGDTLYLLYLELKTKKGRLSQSQVNWREHYEANLRAANTAYAVAYGFAEARSAITDWLGRFQESAAL